MDWHAAWDNLRTLDGDAWDAESERLDALWEKEYIAAFVACALARPTGWTRENAEVWAGELASDARIANAGAPADAAHADVRDCELESE